MNPKKKRTPDPSSTRTDRDWVMIALGVSLLIILAVGVYASMVQGDKSGASKSKGPVKDPKSSSMSEPWDCDSSSRVGLAFSSLHGFCSNMRLTVAFD